MCGKPFKHIKMYYYLEITAVYKSLFSTEKVNVNHNRPSIIKVW